MLAGLAYQKHSLQAQHLVRHTYLHWQLCRPSGSIDAVLLHVPGFFGNETLHTGRVFGLQIVHLAPDDCVHPLAATAWTS